MKKFAASSKWWKFLKIWNIKHNFNLTSDMPRPFQIMPKIFFLLGDDVIDDVKWWPQSFPLYSCLGEVSCGSKLQGQCLVNKCKYHNGLYGLYKPTTISIINTFRDCRSKVNTTGLLCDLQPKFGFTFSFQDRPMPHLVALSDGCSMGNVILAAEW